MRYRLDETSAVLTFIYENNNNGIESILFKYNPQTDHLYVGGYLDHQKGGGSGQISGYIPLSDVVPSRLLDLESIMKIELPWDQWY